MSKLDKVTCAAVGHKFKPLKLKPKGDWAIARRCLRCDKVVMFKGKAGEAV